MFLRLDMNDFVMYLYGLRHYTHPCYLEGLTTANTGKTGNTQLTYSRLPPPWRSATVASSPGTKISSFHRL